MSMVVLTALVIPVDRWGNQSSERISNLSLFCKWAHQWRVPAGSILRSRTKFSETFLRHYAVFQHLQVTCGLWDPFGTALGAHCPSLKEVSPKMPISCAFRPWSVHRHKDNNQRQRASRDPFPLRQELKSTTSELQFHWHAVYIMRTMVFGNGS